MPITFRRSAAAAALCAPLALTLAAAPVAAAPVVYTIEMNAPASGTIDGQLEGTPFSTTSIIFEVFGDTDAAFAPGGGFHVIGNLEFSITIDGFVSNLPSFSRFAIMFEDGADVFSLLFDSEPTPFATATLASGALDWDVTTDLAPVAVNLGVIDWTTLEPSYLTTNLGQLTLDLGPDGSATLPGFISAEVDGDVPVPAAAPLLAAALGLIAFHARRA